MANDNNATFIKLGTVFNTTDKKTGEPKKFIKLGNDAGKDPKYNYTVEVRVTDSNGKVTMLKNPSVTLTKPHPKAPASIANELQVIINND